MATDRQQQIEEILRSLPLARSKGAAIPTHAAEIQLAAAFGMANTMPRAKVARKGKAAPEIKKLANLASKAGLHIGKMHRDSLAAIERNLGSSFHPLVIRDDLAKLVEACARAMKDPVDLTAARGQPRKDAGLFVAHRVASAYADLTGKEPTVTTNPATFKAGGAYLALLTRVFAALEIAASPESMARTVASERRESAKKRT